MNPARLLIRLSTIGFLALSPVLASNPRPCRRVLPRRVQTAGRDEGRYRRLQWKAASRTTVLARSTAHRPGFEKI